MFIVHYQLEEFALSSLVSKTRCCSVMQVWSLLMEETERLIDLMRTSADRLAANILEAVTQIITEKKLVRKLYAEKRNSMDMELDRVHNTRHCPIGYYALSQKNITHFTFAITSSDVGRFS